jgi:hypothetical protein
MKTGLIACIALLLASPSARAEIILHLWKGAACRAADGQLREPRVFPKENAPAHRVANGMIETDMSVEGGDCYLFRSEAKTCDVGRPPAAVGTGGGRIAGTTLGRGCADK